MSWIYPIIGALFFIMGLCALLFFVKEQETWRDRLIAGAISCLFVALGAWLLLPLVAGISDRLLGTAYAPRLQSYQSMSESVEEDQSLSPAAVAAWYAVLMAFAPLAAWNVRRDHPWAARWILLLVPIGAMVLAPRWAPVLDALTDTNFRSGALVAWSEGNLWSHPSFLSKLLACGYLWIGMMLTSHHAGLFTGSVTVLISPFPLLIWYECTVSSHSWWARVLFFLGGTVAGFVLNAVAHAENENEQAKRNARARRLFEAIDRKSRSGARMSAFCLYLRPFATTATLDAQQRTGPGLDFETILERSLHPRFELLALAVSSEAAVLGAKRLYIPDEQWWNYFQRLAASAARIVILPSNVVGSTRAEITWLRESRQFRKCVFLMPETVTGKGFQAQVHLPTTVEVTEGDTTDYRPYWEETRRSLAPLQLPAYDERGALFRMNEEGAVIAMVPLGLSSSFLKVRRTRKALRRLGT